ncbi:MAG: Ig-like domain-containing protein [Verrucomicrobia bacterium]|nr:Ig-like domain-containing protein [Verrucomicrobiota bacterium]
MSALRIEEFAISGPMVQLATPANNTRVILPTNLVLTALAGGFSGLVTNVAYYNGAVKLASLPFAPYAYAWASVTPGSYTLRAVATDNTGVSSTSAPVAITVQSNQPPSIAITSPSDSATFTAPSDIPITVSTSDSDGTIVNVQFYASGLLVGQDPTSPFGYTWPNVPAGIYNLTAVATDDRGARATSSVVRVFVVASTAPTVDSFVPPSGLISNLAQVMVNFNMPVSGVEASDLLINNMPASSVTGSNVSYTFFFPQPQDGLVMVSWAAKRGGSVHPARHDPPVDHHDQPDPWGSRAHSDQPRGDL